MKTIKEKITKAKVQIQMKSSFFAYLSLYLKIKEDNKIPTACINAKGDMYYNAEFFEELSDLELQGVFCFPKGTLVNGKDMKPIEDVIVGDKIINLNGELEKVTKTYKRSVNEDLININAGYVLPIKATNEHPIYVRKYKKLVNGKENRGLKKQFININPIWEKAENVKEGDLVAIPKVKGNIKINEFKLKKYFRKGTIQKHEHILHNFPLNKDTAWFLGLYVADGSSTTKTISIDLNGEKEMEYVLRTEEIVKKYFNITNVSRITTKNSKVLSVRFNSSLLCKFFKDICGKGSHNKKIPYEILFNRNKKLLEEFLKGYVIGDGCICNDRTQFASVSRRLIQELQIAYGRLGYLTNNYLYKREGVYHILNGRELKDLRIYQGYYVNRKRKRNDYLEDKKYFWVKVRKVEKENYCGDVFNLETENTHTYCAENLVVHNCHEIMHLAFLNLTRVGTKNKILWNYATDLANNTMILKESKYELPDGCLKADYHDEYNFIVEGKEYCIEKVSTKRADELYYELNKMKEEHNKDKKNGDEGESENGEGEKGEGNSGNGSPFDDYKGFDEHDYKSLSKEEIKKAEENWTEKMAEAVAISKMKGDCPASIEKMFDELHKEEIDWKEILQRIVTKEIPYDNCYSKPHRKSFNYGVYMPHTLKESVEISVVCDLSGSIGQEEFNTFFSEIVGMARAFQNRIDLNFYSHDTKAYNCGKIRNGNIEEIQKIKLVGGGGTSHKEIFDMLQKDKPKLAIFLTDGYSDLSEIEFDNYNFKKVFVIVKGGSDEQVKGRAEVLKLTK